MDYQSASDRLNDILSDTWAWLQDGFRSSSSSQALSDSSAQPVREQAREQDDSSRVGKALSVGAGGALQPDSISAGSIEGIADAIRDCRDCNLALIRESTVPGTGSSRARLMVITQPPWEYASFETSPLSREEQDYLGKWVQAVGLDMQKDVFVTPVVKCPTPVMRPAMPEEISACSDYLMQQIRSVSPSAILALGSSACAALTGQHSDFGSLVTKDWEWNGIPTLVLWRPAEVLGNPGKLRRPVWESLKRLRKSWDALS